MCFTETQGCIVSIDALILDTCNMYGKQGYKLADYSLKE